MNADTGIATDSARVAWSARWARWLARPCQRLFAGRPMPHLQVPGGVGLPRTKSTLNLHQLVADRAGGD